jgi:ATP-dependent DNA helicase RecG
LALALYGDLEICLLDERPPGRKPTETKVFHGEHRAEAYDELLGSVRRGQRAYVICPLVESSEKVDLRDAEATCAELREILGPDSVALVHGRLNSVQKALALQAFASGRARILVATTVVEVGIDVPGVDLMLIEGAERFGLSQIHQLRGRIGRSGGEGRCLLVTSPRQGGQASRQRLEALERTADGFELAEADLAIRGPGEFLGTRQAGAMDLSFADLRRDGELLLRARRAAIEIVRRDPDLSRPDNAELRAMARRGEEFLAP